MVVIIKRVLYLDPFNKIALSAWISNHIYYKVWNEITNPFPNFNGETIEVWEWDK